jgi:DNA-binding NtrC family response regulator
MGRVFAHDGEHRERVVDVRVIAATNRSLQEEIAHRRFRDDLYFRLAVASCDIPPLRKRPEDIEALIRFWLPRLSSEAGRCPPKIAPGVFAALRARLWPGNARELRNVLERALCFGEGPIVTEQHVRAAIASDSVIAVTSPLTSMDRVQATLDATHWNRAEAARRLGIGRTTLWRWLRKTERSKRLVDS